MKVCVVIKTVSEDHVGTYKEVECVCSTPEIARAKVKELNENPPTYDTEYYYDIYDVI